MTRRWTQPQHRPDPHRTAVTAASTLLDRPDWWVEARRMKRAMRRAAQHDPTAGHLWHETRREFRHLATRRGLAQLREA